MPKFNFTKENLTSYILIITGSFIMSVGFVIFVSPLKLAPGGVYGIAIILHHHFNFPIGLSGICFDLPLLLIGTLVLGPKFGAKTLVGIISLSASISVMEYLYQYEPLIADTSTYFVQAVFGGVIIGTGLGIIFKTKATSGGTDILATILKRYSHLSIGSALIVVDSIVVLIALIAFNDWTIPLYSWIVIYVSSTVADKVVKGFNTTQTVLIISDKYEEISKKITEEMERGATLINAQGVFSGNEKKIIFTNISIREVATVRRYIRHIDPAAFVTVIDANEVIGDGFKSIHEKY
ncbi:MAG: YitT family protein [Prevotellaceae bacterium]|nr:YitT family protein [Prevotellaceae bacterium]